MKLGGIDVGKNKHFACVLDLDQNRLHMALAAPITHAVVDWMNQHKPDSIAVDSPAGPNIGVLASWSAAHRKEGIQNGSAGR
jgi:septum formation inhibitor-activating ATPase MinD